ncbi:SurA N-terminal domain-containing protein [Streptomyces sp. NBC_00091]|uniref:SurA N-terminal domain-containing protein n=1 Tax=Streptomyces sp. NBC_00091 TaxID=2975648 RepID=UPI002253BE67|nr:SurA N-terminal domain-containing protein [Streptomyces sp. NBC_00091]MCX5377958.1 SurA N-terminal domain-containing protein [Streptomyces sp. NBC_00091]
MHRRTALSVSAVLLVAAPLLTACSGEARPGTAAVVGGERITTSALQAQVNDVRAAQNRSEQGAQLIGATSGLERLKLNKMIQSAVLERAAKDAGLSVSAKETEDVRKAQLQQVGGEKALADAALQQAQLAPDQIEADTRFKLLRDKVFAHYGSQDKALVKLGEAAKALRIEVNPRYGRWDAQQILLGDQETPWITQRTRPEQAAPAGA